MCGIVFKSVFMESFKVAFDENSYFSLPGFKFALCYITEGKQLIRGIVRESK